MGHTSAPGCICRPPGGGPEPEEPQTALGSACTALEAPADQEEPRGPKPSAGSRACLAGRDGGGRGCGGGCPHAPEMACTATRRKPFTSPFSLTMATRCTSGTGYSRLLRYTKALGEERPWSGPPAGHPAEAAGWAHNTTLRSGGGRAARRGQPGRGQAGAARAGRGGGCGSGQGRGAGGRGGQRGGGFSLLQG